MGNQLFFEIQFCNDGQFYFRMLDQEGRLLEGREDFVTKGNVPTEFEWLIKNAEADGKFEMLTAEDGREYFALHIGKEALERLDADERNPMVHIR